MTQSSTDSSLVCDDCSVEVVSWHAPNDLWNRVMGGVEAKDDPGGCLCPNCFIERAETADVSPVAWVVTPADRISTLERELEDARAKVERQWCLSCGTITRDGTCDCSSDCPETQRLVNYADEVRADASKLSAALTAAEAKVARMGEALKFYRDEFHPRIGKPMPGASSITFHPSEALLEDCGNRAMAALQSEKDREGEDGR